MNNRLWGSRVYCVGAMDRSPDCGFGWRKTLTPFLENKGIVVLDPCNKPIEIGHEKVEDRDRRTIMKKEGKFVELAKEMRLLRTIDLRLVDICDFIIFNLDVNIHACGSYEEAFWANRMKKPVLIRCIGGRYNLPDWLWGAFPPEHIFDDWDSLKEYVRHVDEDEQVEHMKRWMFFDFRKMMPKVSYRG